MAKDRFYRSKPHVNVALQSVLAQLGISAQGIHEVAFGHIVTDPKDRELVTDILAAPRHAAHAASGLPTGKRQHKPVSVTKPVDKAVLQQLGFTSAGANQLAFGYVVTDPEDRNLLVQVLDEATQSPS